MHRYCLPWAFLCCPLLVQAATTDSITIPQSASLSCNVTNVAVLACNYSDWYPSSWSAETPVSANHKFIAVRLQYGSPSAGVVCAREQHFFGGTRTVCSNYQFGRYYGSMSAVTVQTDTDGDVRIDTYDNCPSSSNTDQLNTDSDSQGNVCDTDDDNDGVPDTVDADPLDNANTNEIALPLDGTSYKGVSLKSSITE